MKNIINRLLQLTEKESTTPVLISEEFTFKTTYPDVRLGEKEWMKRFKVGSQYSRFSTKKPQETRTMCDIYQHNPRF